MRFTGRVIRAVGVLVMLVVGVGVLVFHRLVTVLVFVTLGQMQPDPQHHENGSETESDGKLVA